MPNVLVISKYAESSYLWHRLESEGCKVKVFIFDPKYRHEIYEGLIDKVEHWAPWVSWCDFALFDGNSNETLDIWKRISKSKKCFGGSEFGHELEKDRKFGHEVFDYIGLKRVESLDFKTIKEAQAHIKSHKVKHVVKPYGGKTDSWDVVISDDENGTDAIAMLSRLESRKVPYDGVQVEERKIGVEVGISAWCGGSRGFIGDLEVNFEHKKSHSGNPEGQGFLTGEMGTIQKYVSRDNKFFKETLAKVEKICKDCDYRGQIDISFIADDKGFWPLEFTTRLGYPALALNLELQKTPAYDLLYGIATGKLENNEVHSDFCCGVVQCGYGFPFEEQVKARGKELPILDLTEDNIQHIYMYEVKAGMHDKDKPGLVTSFGSGYVLTACGLGKTIPEAKKSAYKYLEGKDAVRIPLSWHRTDIGDRVMDQMDKIKEYGIL